MCSEPMFETNSERPTDGQRIERPARKNPSVLAATRAAALLCGTQLARSLKKKTRPTTATMTKYKTMRIMSIAARAAGVGSLIISEVVFE